MQWNGKVHVWLLTIDNDEGQSLSAYPTKTARDRAVFDYIRQGMDALPLRRQDSLHTMMSSGDVEGAARVYFTECSADERCSLADQIVDYRTGDSERMDTYQRFGAGEGR